jgi:hypothetical protein
MYWSKNMPSVTRTLYMLSHSTHWMEHNITPYEIFLDHIDNNIYSFYRHYKNYIKLLHQSANSKHKKSLGFIMQKFVHLFLIKQVPSSTCFPLFLISLWNITLHIFLNSSIINLRSTLSFVHVQVVSLEDVSRWMKRINKVKK